MYCRNQCTQKVPTLYTDDNKKIIEEMGTIVSEYDEKLTHHEDYYPMYHDLRKHMIG
ncbi:hypothetical protein [Vallitalea sp.]|uniref:hypothetical protein n=1 Tax=Vallitalea sp. TaxID=1882829 RepID=UPI0025D2756B|nr:hypothetical protein [Vallitalea sp.]MCT4686383.1 hypothetical protein [Vallitalea sp.]